MNWRINNIEHKAKNNKTDYIMKMKIIPNAQGCFIIIKYL